MRLRHTFLQKILFLCGLCFASWKLGVLKHPAMLPTREEPSWKVDVQPMPRDSVDIKVEPFAFREDFSFPQPRVMKELRHIKKASWLRNLHRYLQSLDTICTKQIYLLTSNYDYLDVLLNWLISAVVRSNVTIQCILTISMDYSTHSILQAKGFPSVFVSPSNLFIPNFNFSAPFERVMMLRLSLMRVISHFGFDVAMIDTDAIMLRNPQPLFEAQEGIDIVGSMGTIPNDLMAEWPRTICIGVVLVRSSARTEQYWNSMENIHRECLDDQGKLNYGLKALNIKWYSSNCSYQNTTIYGKASNSLQVSILPYNDVCRLDTCIAQLRGRYYFWHKGGHRSRRKKLQSAREGNTWFLKYKWNKISNSHVGKDWLRSIAYLGATVS